MERDDLAPSAPTPSTILPRSTPGGSLGAPGPKPGAPTNTGVQPVPGPQTSTATVAPAPADPHPATAAEVPVGTAVVIALVLAAVAAVGAAAVAWALARRRGAVGPVTGRPADPLAPPPLETNPGAGDDTRDTLVEALIDVRDALDLRLVDAQRAGLALQAVGVRDVDPTGERFDPARHQQVDTVMTTDARLDGTVAQVDRLGYVDGGELRRFPQVVVWRCLPEGVAP